MPVSDKDGRVESVVKIQKEDTGATEFYRGLTGRPYKERWYVHMNSIKGYDPDDSTYGKRMSWHLGELNREGITNIIV